MQATQTRRAVPVSEEVLAYQEQVNSAEFDRVNELHELATDIAERMGPPMNHLVEYDLIDGQAWCVTARLSVPMVKITGDALVDGRSKYHGENQFQMDRLMLEHEEAQLVDSFFRGELQGNVLSVVSLIPDAVRDETASIEGYRRDLMRSLVRIYYVTDDGKYRCRMFSIDQSDRDAMRAVGSVLGVEIGVNDPSEVVLGRRSVVSMRSVTDTGIAQLAEMVIDQNDAILLNKTGSLTRAGSKFLDQKDALAVVKLHGKLLEECRQNISIINASGLSANDKRVRIDAQMKRTTGAINAAIDGHAVSSSGDAVAGQYVEDNNYSNDCPTGPSSLEKTLSQQLESKEISMTCPFCHLTTVGDPCARVLVCTNCEAKVQDGSVVSEGIGRKAALERRRKQNAKSSNESVSESSQERSNTKRLNRVLLQALGERASIRQRVVWGGAAYDIVHELTGEVFQENVDRGEYTLAA